MELMTLRATGWINVIQYDPQPYDETAGATLSAVLVHEDFTGGLAGRGDARFLLVKMHDGRAYFTGVEHFTGTLAGRSGAFLLFNTGILKDGAVNSEWVILPGSASGGLAGLRGSGGATHAGYFLDYSFE
ncbi:MAG: DUF3224 domain-containing protein [Terracidiphilus sp.]